MSAHETSYTEVVQACGYALDAIRKNHPEIPKGIPVLVASKGRRENMLGWTQHDRWTFTDKKGERTRLPEIGVSAEDLHRGARQVFVTILHEAVHAWCSAKKIEDTSRRGSYHNGRFAEAAARFGLKVAKHPRIGCTTPDLTDEAGVLYLPQLRDLERVLYLHRHPEPKRSRPKDRNLVVASCSVCGAKIRASARTLTTATVSHGDGGVFETE